MDTNTQERTREDGGRDLDDAMRSQRAPRMASHQQRTGERKRGFFWASAGRTQPSQLFDFRLLAFTTMREYISVVLSSLVCGTCYSSCRKLIHTLTNLHILLNKKE